MAKYLINRVVEAYQWTEGLCPCCGRSMYKDGCRCLTCHLYAGDWIIEWEDPNDAYGADRMMNKKFIRYFKKVED